MLLHQHEMDSMQLGHFPCLVCGSAISPFGGWVARRKSEAVAKSLDSLVLKEEAVPLKSVGRVVVGGAATLCHVKSIHIGGGNLRRGHSRHPKSADHLTRPVTSLNKEVKGGGGVA